MLASLAWVRGCKPPNGSCRFFGEAPKHNKVMQESPSQENIGQIFDAFARIYEPATLKTAAFFKTTSQIRDIIFTHHGHALSEAIINQELIHRKFTTYAMPETGEIVWLLAHWDNV